MLSKGYPGLEDPNARFREAACANPFITFTVDVSLLIISRVPLNMGITLASAHTVLSTASLESPSIFTSSWSMFSLSTGYPKCSPSAAKHFS